MKTSGRLFQHMKPDNALASQALASGAANGRYFSFTKAPKLMFIGHVGALAAADTVIFSLRQATSRDGAGTKDVSVVQGATFDSAQTITANTNVSAVTLTCVTAVATNTVTINGVTLEAVDGAPGDLEFDIRTDDTSAAADLARAINANVPGVHATSAIGVVTVIALDPSGVAITAATTGGTITPATLDAACIIEVEEHDLDRANDYAWVALRADTGAGTHPVSGTLIRIPDDLPARLSVSAVTYNEA
jgi:hypothetical protein